MPIKGTIKTKQKTIKVGDLAEKLQKFCIRINEKIREEMLLGINKKNLKCIYNIGNRRKAIEFGINNLKRDDIFVITGKGHEEYQIFNNQKKYFSDYKIVEKILG